MDSVMLMRRRESRFRAVAQPFEKAVFQRELDVKQTDLPETAKIVITIAVLVSSITIPFYTGCSAIETRIVEASEKVIFTEISDLKKSPESVTETHGEETSQIETETYNLPVWEGYVDPYAQYEVFAPTYSPSGISGDPNGLNSFVGVVEWNGTRETAYSSNVLYHYRTSEWTPDEHGFYRTDDGYYVVSSDDYEQGTVIETSRGPAIVSDCGVDSGTVDFYVNW